jgi:natural product biosynthesis luciferase-like monooxygenase protein
MASPLAAVFVGSDTLLMQCLERWRELGHRVVAVATDTDKVRRFCAERGLRCLDATGDLPAQLAGEPFDWLFAITWLRLLPDAVLALPRKSTINFHDGPLPRYAGLNATCWAILHGEAEHGVTWHLVEAKADTGAILLQRRFPLAADETAFTLNARCFQVGQETFGELCQQLANGTAVPKPQDLACRSWFGKSARPPALAVLDWQRPVAELLRLVRAFDHGGYKNPVALPSIEGPLGVAVPGHVERIDGSGSPGTVLAVGDDQLDIGAVDGVVRATRLRCLRGLPLPAAALQALGFAVGAKLPVRTAAELAERTASGQAAAKAEDAWLAALLRQQPLPVPDGMPAGASPRPTELELILPGSVDPFASASLLVAFLLRQAAAASGSIGVACGASGPATTPFVVPAPPCTFEVPPEMPIGEALRRCRDALVAHRQRGPLLRELPLRRGDALPAGLPLELPIRLGLGGELPPLAAGGLQFVCGDGGRVGVRFDAAALPRERAETLLAHLQVFARAAVNAPTTPIAAVPTIAAAELQQLLHGFNATAGETAAESCIHRQFAAMARQQPERTALQSGGDAISYQALAERVERLAGWLRARGVGRGDRVGICVQRGFGMVAAVLATLRCGAGYVPLDPSYPRERLAFMVGDAELAALVVDASSVAIAPSVSCPRIDLDADAAAIAAATVPADDAADGEQIAYVIYTSGSTGRPKGVMVRHRNVTNFFAGMDRVLGTEPATWLAVTSLSFDISVLELLWTLCRGFTVVVHHGEGAAAAATASRAPVRPIRFSLFYFASDEGEHQGDKYRLLYEGARFGDEHGFEAIWTPERHFHAFGGLYPNPAVASAAVAAMTKNIQIRAGSCVVTLHHPIRVAEDWSLVDNLSGGRVGIAFAAGWHARDFVLRPETFLDRKNALTTSMRQVQALWRGEAVEFPGHDGKLHAIRTLPRPIQKELPSWITVAGNPETYRLAGEAGCNVLTHLLGQSLDELRQKLDVYRQAWRAKGHPGEGRVTLMLHTFVGDDEDKVREIVREPMKGYLRSSLDLVKQAAWSFPAFKNRVDKPGEMDALLNGGLTPADFEALLEFSFERYYRTSGLFGTPESCVQTVDRLRAMQIDEIACLIDFGVPTELVLQSFKHLDELKRRCDSAAAATAASSEPTAAAPPRASIPELLRQHRVTHFQCTPSMATMLLVDPAAKEGLRGLQHMLVGGEALPKALANELRSLVPNLHDVYGPTETTVWSTTMRVGDDDPVPIGRPLLNQRCYVLDANLQPVPIGAAGELWIGGAGVTAGYFRRPELTSERFRPDPFADGGTIYGTGDLVRWRADGVLEYLGRKDHQVKVRGYRIELGEIEQALGQHKGVREGVVVARNDGGETRLCAYWVAKSQAPTLDELRTHLRGLLPEFMVPSHFVLLPDLPRTPNLKVDRNALPAPETVAAATAKRTVAAAQDPTEDSILQIWKQALATDNVGVEDNFFDSGGHSILAVRVHREIVQRLGVELSVTDLFRFPTVRSLARHLDVGKQAPTAAQQAMERAKARRNLLRRGS